MLTCNNTQHPAAMGKSRPSCMVRKFLNYDPSKDPRQFQLASDDSAESSWPSDPFRQAYYFFYGTLMDPSTLAKVLQLPEPPTMRPAKVVGFHTKLWGPYPTLLHGPSGHEVDGLTYEILSEKQHDRLCAYETDKYRFQPCMIDFLDGAVGVGKMVEGVTFM